MTIQAIERPVSRPEQISSGFSCVVYEAADLHRHKGTVLVIAECCPVASEVVIYLDVGPHQGFWAGVAAEALESVEPAALFHGFDHEQEVEEFGGVMAASSSPEKG